MRSGQRGYAAAQCQDVAHAGGAGFELVDGGLVKGAGHGHTGPHGRDHDNVTRHEGQVTRFVAARDEVVEVQGADGFAGAFELDVAHGAVGAGATAGKEGIDQGAEARQVVGARLLRLADHINLDAAQTPDGGVGLEVGENLAQMSAQGFVQITHRHARKGHHADFGDVDLAIAVNLEAGIEVYRAPNLQTHFIARAEQVVVRGGQGAVGGVSLGCVKQVAAIHGQQAAGGLLHKTLKLVGLGDARCRACACCVGFALFGVGFGGFFCRGRVLLRGCLLQVVHTSGRGQGGGWRCIGVARIGGGCGIAVICRAGRLGLQTRAHEQGERGKRCAQTRRLWKRHQHGQWRI